MSKELDKQLNEFRKTGAIITTAVVVAVDKTSHTCSVDMDGLEIPDVRLRSVVKDSNPFVVYPKIGSNVSLLPIGAASAGYYLVVAVEEVESVNIKIEEMTFAFDAEGIKINGDAYGGMVNAKELKKQLDLNTKAIDVLQNALKTWVAIPGDGGYALKIIAAPFTALPLANLTKIENKNIKHG